MSLETSRLDDKQLTVLNELLGELTNNQLIWLSGYLEGKLAINGEGAIPVKQELAKPVASVANLAILYGTETGNSKELADKMAEKAAFRNISARIYDMHEYKVENLANEDNVAVIVSTHGEGEVPEIAEEFYEYITGENVETLENVSFSVLALGDKTYKYFCKTGEEIFNAFKDLGAFSIVPISKCDVDYDLSAEIWMNNFLMNVTPATLDSVIETDGVDFVKEYSKSHLFNAKVLDKIKITGEESEKEVYHIELSLEGSGLNYEPGDAVGICAKNPDALVDKIIETAGFNPGQMVFINKGQISLKDAITNHLEITVLTFHLLNSYYTKTQNPKLKKILDDDKLLDEYLYGRDLLDLLVDFPFEWNANKLVEILRPVPARLYSISSSQEVVGEQVHATVSLVRYEKENRIRLGACTSHLAYDIEIGGQVPIYIDKNPLFKLPEDNSAIIMVGTGTGIAPYRGFMQHRESKGHKGYSWLFYGDRNVESDFLYKKEWEKLMEEESLERLDVAFSRDQKEKVYVQHKLMENQEEIFEWIENGAHFYLCGDVKHMAKDVNKTMLEIICLQGGVDEKQAKKYLKTLKHEKRFQTDVY